MAEKIRYHVSKKTGRPNQCRAQEGRGYSKREQIKGREVNITIH